jgi:4-amino-4-deoxy-L-arabinose transferase-like glycosyltransferase
MTRHTESSGRQLAGTARTTWAIVTLLLFGLVLRIAYAVAFTGAISSEGAEYATLANNLLSGKGYIGIAFEGPQLLFPPLYPLAIAAASLLTGGTFSGSIAVSVVAGALLILPVSSIAGRVYGTGAALISAILVAVHPTLVVLSASPFCESLYITLFVSGVYFTLRCLDGDTLRHALLAGVMLGLAYLVTPQAFALGLVYAIGLAIRPGARRSRALGQAAGLVVAFLLVAAPYVAFLYSQTGAIRLEYKSPVNASINERVLSGMEHGRAQYEVGADLEPKGTFLLPRERLARLHESERRAGLLDVFVAEGPRGMQRAVMLLAGAEFLGSPAIAWIAVLGLFSAPWDRRQLTEQAVLLAAAAVSVLVVLSIVHTEPLRYFMVLIPLLIVWSARGVVVLGRWAGATYANLARSRYPSRTAGLIVSAAVIAGIVAFALIAVDDVPNFRESGPTSRALLQAGEWIAGQYPDEKTVMDSHSNLSFHAGADYLPMPWCDAKTALAYADRHGADFIVVRAGELLERPYLTQWWTDGLGNVRAREVFRSPAGTEEPVVVYRWERDSGLETRGDADGQAGSDA